MKPFTISQLLWFASGVDPEIIASCPPRERMRYALFGTCVFIPTCLALFSSASALTYVTDSWQLIALISVSWAFIVFSIDRTLMLDDGKLSGGFLMRICLAVCVAFMLSVPIELKMFKESIDKSIVQAQDSTAKAYIKSIESKIDSIEKQINGLDESWKAKRKDYEQEIDGSGGSGITGVSIIAQIKKQIYKDDSTAAAPKIRAFKLQEEALKIRVSDKYVKSYVESISADDLLARIEILDKLAQENQSVEWAIWILRMVLILLEIIPVAVKSSIGSKGVYQNLQQSLDEKTIEINKQLTRENIEMSVLFERLENIQKRHQIRLEHAKARAKSIFDKLKVQEEEILRGIEEKKQFETLLLQSELDEVTRLTLEQTKERIFHDYFEGVANLFGVQDN